MQSNGALNRSTPHNVPLGSKTKPSNRSLAALYNAETLSASTANANVTLRVGCAAHHVEHRVEEAGIRACTMGGVAERMHEKGWSSVTQRDTPAAR